ncbi:MAG: hypothetical protein GHCLOJNM_04173 [bacterium]|nr:hypothetical protein [bacterium]
MVAAAVSFLPASPAQIYPGSASRYAHGYVDTVYRSRWSEGESDQDLYQYWDVEMEELVPGHARGAFSLRLNTDINGRVDHAPGLGEYIFDRDPFYSVDDSRDEEYVDLYTGYVDLYNGSPANGYLRIGRQYMSEFDWIQVDGVSVNLPVTSWAKVLGYFGQAVSYYSGHTDDWSGGIGLELKPSIGSRWLFEIHRYEDDIADNDSWKAEVWQRLWEGAFFHARFRGLDGEARDLWLDVSQYIAPMDLTLFLNYRRLFTNLEDESRQDSPLYRSGLLEQNAHNYFSVGFDKALPCNFGLSGGLDIQRVGDHSQDYGDRDYEHGNVTLSYYPSRVWRYSVSGEWWNTDPESSSYGMSGEVGYSPTKCIDWTLGTSYTSYVFRYEEERAFPNPNFPAVLYRETPFVKTYYTGLRWKVNECNDLRVNFEIEDDDQDNDYYTLRVKWGQTF